MNAPLCEKKILFVTPPYHCGVVEVAGRWIPLNFVYLAGAARQAGVEAEIYDAMTKGDTYPEMARRFQEANARYVAATAMTCTVNDAVKTLELAKSVNPDTVTILGGIHPSFMYDEVLRSSDGIDYVVVGEGELTLWQLLTVLEQGGDPSTVAGIAYLDGDTVVKTAKRGQMHDIDDLPAAWDLLEWNDYEYFILPGSRLGAISTSRGCDHDCVVCSQPEFWEKSWRPRDPWKVADEIDHLFHTYGVNVFLVTDENAARDPHRWEAFLDAIIEKGLQVYLIMEARAAELVRDQEILWKYRKAGVTHISIGIEATDQAQLKQLKSCECVDFAKVAIDLVREEGMVTEAAFVMGFPEDTTETARYLLKLAQYYNPDHAHFMPVTPWPYSRLHQEVKEQIRETDYGRYNWIDPIVEPVKMTMRQVDVAIVDCYRKFYMAKMLEVMTMKDGFRRRYLMRAMKLIMASPFILKKLRIATIGRRPVRRALNAMNNKQ